MSISDIQSTPLRRATLLVAIPAVYPVYFFVCLFEVGSSGMVELWNKVRSVVTRHSRRFRWHFSQLHTVIARTWKGDH